MKHHCTMADESRLTMEQRFRSIEVENQRLQLQEERSRQLRDEPQRLQTESPKIQRVAHHLRDRQDFAKHYVPKLVSFGPIHHGAAHLQLGERYKLMWLAMYVKSTGKDARGLHKRIADNIRDLKDLLDKDLFDKDDQFNNCESQGFKDLDEKLSWILFVDGCALLQILDRGRLGEDFDYHKLNLKIDQLILLRQDVLLLENQLPFQVLRLLSCHENADAKLLESMDEFFCTHNLWPYECPSSTAEKKENKDPKSKGKPGGNNATNVQQERKLVPQPPVHVLDYLHRTIVGDRFSEKHPSIEPRITHRNIQELKASGIELKKLGSGKAKDIKFSAVTAELELPEITVDDATAPTFLNLIAYEMCPDFRNDYGISSFVAFLDSLIDHPDDVKQLRSAGILRNALGSDVEVSELFNTISRDLVTQAGSFADVRREIQRHYDDKWKTRWAEAYSQHFSSPWSTIGFSAAVVALVLTIVQTVFGVLSVYR